MLFACLVLQSDLTEHDSLLFIHVHFDVGIPASIQLLFLFKLWEESVINS